MPNRSLEESRYVRKRSPRRRSLAAIAAMIATLVVATIALPAVGAGPAEDPEDYQPGLVAAWNGASWLSNRLDAAIPLQNFGGPSWGATLDAGIAVAAVDRAWGTTHSSTAAVWAAVESDPDAAVQSKDAADPPNYVDNPGLLAKAIVFAVAIGEDPTDVGSGPSTDLVARLLALIRTTGPDAGLFGPASPTYDGATRQGLAIRALSAAGVIVPAEAVSWLISQQCDDGAWMAYRSDLLAPCVVDVNAGTGPGPDATGWALDGLSIIDAPTTPDDWTEGRQWLADNANSDGGWGYLPGQNTDANSTAIALLALMNPGDLSAYQAHSGALMAFSLACESDEDPGAFETQWSPGVGDLIATNQAVAALAMEGSLAATDQPADEAKLATPQEGCVNVADVVATSSSTSSTTPTSVATTVAPTTVPTTVATTVPTSVQAATTAVPSQSPTVAAANTSQALAVTGSDTSIAPYGAAAVVLGLLLVVGTRPSVRQAFTGKSDQ